MIRLRREKAREYDEEATEVVDVPSSVGGRLRLMCKRHAQVRSTRIALENALPRRRACSMSSDVILEANSIMQTRVAISQSVSCQFIFAVQTVSLEVVN
jgi:hypothetical protein